MPTTSQIHLTSRLSNLGLLYSNSLIGPMIGQQILPMVPVSKTTDTYTVFDKEDRFTIPDTALGNRSNARRVTWGTSTATYTAVNNGLEDLITDQDFSNQDELFNLSTDTMENLIDIITLGYEKRVADLVFSSATITQGVTLSGTDQWNDYTNSDPLQDIQTAINGTFIPANTVAMGQEVFEQLLNHPDMVERFIRNGSLANNAAIMAEIFDVDEVLVGKAKYNTANIGATPVYARVWGKHFLAFYKRPAPTRRTISLGYTFSFSTTGNAGGLIVSRRRDDAIGLTGGEIIKVAQSTDEVVVAADVGYLITNAVA